MRRRRYASAAAAAKQGAPLAVHVECTAVADPDVASIERERAIRSMTGELMQGHNGTVIDYDRGDPAHSFTAVVTTPIPVADAYARLGVRDAVHLANPEFYDLGSSDEQLTAYQANLFARIAR